MANLDDIGKFSESGRGIPIALSRPQGALPYSPLVRQAFALHPLARLGWGQGIITVGDVMLEAIDPLGREASLREVAHRMLRDEEGFVPVCDGGRFLGVIYFEEILQCVADDRNVPNVAQVLSTQIPTCELKSTLVDAVRQMIACYLRKIPVVGDAGELVGLLTLAEAAAAGARDPAVEEVLARFATSPSLFARPLR